MACEFNHPCFNPQTGKCDCDIEVNSPQTLMKLVNLLTPKQKLNYFTRIFEKGLKE